MGLALKFGDGSLVSGGLGSNGSLDLGFAGLYSVFWAVILEIAYESYPFSHFP